MTRAACAPVAPAEFGTCRYLLYAPLTLLCAQKTRIKAGIMKTKYIGSKYIASVLSLVLKRQCEQGNSSKSPAQPGLPGRCRRLHLMVRQNVKIGSSKKTMIYRANGIDAT